MLLLASSIAFAETASLIPAGAAVIYGGIGATTYGSLNTGDPGGTAAERDVSRAVQSRAETYVAWAPIDRLQLSGYLPLVYSTVLDADDVGPCEGATGNCAPIATVGASGVQARLAILRAPIALSVGMGVSSQAWNAGIRRGYTMVGEATTDLLPGLYVGFRRGVGALTFDGVLYGIYAFRIPGGDQTDLADKAPRDDVRAGVELGVAKGPIEVHVGGHTLQRLGGTGFYAHPDSEDVWATVDYDSISASAKLSWILPGDSGIHLAAARVLWTHNGPVDATDVTLGVHHYWSGRKVTDAARL